VNGQVLLGLLLVFGAAAYGLDLWRRPYTRCGRCKGTGRVAWSTDKRWGPCPRCTGKPPRARIGAQLVRPGIRRK